MKPKPWHDCPPCPKCGLYAIVAYSLVSWYPGCDLRCAACGHQFKGTAEQLEQARRADAAWEKEER